MNRRFPVVLLAMAIVGCNKSGTLPTDSTPEAKSNPPQISLPAQDADNKDKPVNKSHTELTPKERAAWEGKVKQVPDDFLAVYVEAAKIHVGRNSSCAYVFVRSRTPNDEISIECPPPPEIMTTIQKRLKDFRPGKGPYLPFGVWSSEGKNCKSFEAGAIWHEAINKVNWE